MSSETADVELPCPLWVQFLDRETGLPYFFNVRTRERACRDPEPEPGPSRGAPAAGPVRPSAPVVAQGAEPSALWRSRPARVQRPPEAAAAAYVQGHEEYNVWYGRYESDRFNPREREPAPSRCEPAADSGWTQADLPGAETSHFCIFYARGSCNAGHRCRYYHRLPTQADGDACDPAHDIFGRERFAGHREDMGGVGSFNSDCRTLFVGDLRFDRASRDTVQQLERLLWEDFGAWGDIQQVHVVPSKALAFVRYAYRAAAEFAKVAMSNQQLGLARCISVRWAVDDPNPRTAKQRRTERQLVVEAAVERRIAAVALSEAEVAAMRFMNGAEDSAGAMAPYPDTSSQYPAPRNLLSGSAEGPNAVLGPATLEEVEAEAKRTEALVNAARLSAVLARIDALRGGEQPAAQA
mmetsp:Transcript_29806/g.95021  ORF Transcript_29806/g.95021 Transcript_29806/m.95021 type:complete len:410 (+) Transcript_29806:71-1300(+)